MDDFEAAVWGLHPNLVAFGISLSKNVDDGEDLAVDAIARALKARDTFELGTNLKAWLFTILRNEFYNVLRKKKFHQNYQNLMTPILDQRTRQEQEVSAEMTDVMEHLALLRPDHRRALTLVAIQGLSYEAAAELEGIAVGTLKSRVDRARNALTKSLETPGKIIRQLPDPEKTSTVIARTIVQVLKAPAPIVLPHTLTLIGSKRVPRGEVQIFRFIN